MRRLKGILLVLLVMLAGFSACLALKPLVFSARKAHQMHTETQAFYLEAADAQQAAVQEGSPIPYEDLLKDIQQYNENIYLTCQSELTSREAYQDSEFDLTAYGLPDNVFGVLSIPKMDLEMPLYLGASDENMALGATVLAETSIPIGGTSSNAVIAGHRGWGGAKYFKDIELLEVGDEVSITNLWEELTYRVTEIKIIDPSDISSILIQPGRDLVTLLTCHPYGSDGLYRYLVFCERAASS